MTQRQEAQIKLLKDHQFAIAKANIKLVKENEALRKRLEKVLWMLVDQSWQTK